MAFRLVRRIASACGCIGVRGIGVRGIGVRGIGVRVHRRTGASACGYEATAGHDLERVKGRMVKRTSVCHVLLALTAPVTGRASAATAGVLHRGRGDREKTNLELLAWLGLRPDSSGQHSSPGLRQAFLDRR
jgi:hypothetical protein